MEFDDAAGIYNPLYTRVHVPKETVEETCLRREVFN